MKKPLQIISFPKAGRTWLRVMLDDVGIPTQFTHDGSDHQLRNPLGALDPDKRKYDGASILLLVRDPRDTFVSGYFQVTRRLKISTAGISEILRDERHGIAKICHFNLQWFDAARRLRRIAILTYEQMHRSPAAALCAVADFAGEPLDERIAELVATNRAFARLRAAEASGELAHRYGQYLLPGDRNDAESFKVRRGLVGGFKDYLSAEDQAFCEKILAETDYDSRLGRAILEHGFAQFR